GTWPDEWPNLLQADPASKSKNPTFQLARLARIHDDLASYYYSHLYLASRDPYALLEFFYHQISSLRYLTRLDAWLQLLEDRSRPMHKEHHESLSRWFASWGRDDEPIQAVRGQRQQLLRALRRAFEREREALLSLICADTLIGWVAWIRQKDLKQFLVRRWTAEQNIGPSSTWQDSRVLEKSVAAFSKQLDELKADALLNKMDFDGCLRVRFQQIGRLIKRRDLVPDTPRVSFKKLVGPCKAWFPGKSSKDLLKL